MKNLAIIIFLIIACGGKCQEVDFYEEETFPFATKTSINLNAGGKFSYHYGRLVLTNFSVFNRNGRDVESIKQTPFLVADLSLSVNHFITPHQEVIGGIGFSEHAYDEEGKLLVFQSQGNIRSLAYGQTISFYHYYYMVGHRFTFNNFRHFFPFIENNLQHDWLTYEENPFANFSFFKRSGYSYKVHLGIRSKRFPFLIEKLKIDPRLVNIMFSVFYQTAIVKYNIRKINRDYYPIGFGANFSLSIGIK